MKTLTLTEGNQLLIKPEYHSVVRWVDFKETSEQHDGPEGLLRLYCTYIGDSEKNENHFKLQIRAFQPLVTPKGHKGKPRNLIATFDISDSELQALAAHATRLREEHGTIKITPEIISD